MIVFTNLEELKKYLEMRKEMAEKQKENSTDSFVRSHATGMIFAFNEAIKAVGSMIGGK